MRIYKSLLIFVKRNTDRVKQVHENGFLWRKGGERVEATGTEARLL